MALTENSETGVSILELADRTVQDIESEYSISICTDRAIADPGGRGRRRRIESGLSAKYVHKTCSLNVPSDRASDRERGTDDDEVFDDVLPFDSEAVWDDREYDPRQQDDWQECARELYEQQEDSNADQRAV